MINVRVGGAGSGLIYFSRRDKRSWPVCENTNNTVHRISINAKLCIETPRTLRFAFILHIFLISIGEGRVHFNGSRLFSTRNASCLIREVFSPLSLPIEQQSHWLIWWTPGVSAINYSQLNSHYGPHLRDLWVVNGYQYLHSVNETLSARALFMPAAKYTTLTIRILL